MVRAQGGWVARRAIEWVRAGGAAIPETPPDVPEGLCYRSVLRGVLWECMGADPAIT